MLKETVVQPLASVLKEHGFRRNGLTWNRNTRGVGQVIDIQRSRWNDAAKQDFTVNIGGISNFAWTICWDRTFPQKIAIDECFPAFRVGEVLDDFRPQSIDHWWCLTAEMKQPAIDALQDEIIEVVRRKCLPILDELRTEVDLLRFALHLPDGIRGHPANRLYYAILLAHNGRTREALDELSQFQDPKLAAWQDRVEGVKSRLMLDLAN